MLTGESFRSVYFPPGLGHTFVALEDDTVMCLPALAAVSQGERAGDLGPRPGARAALPEDLLPIQSERDRVAPTLAEARALGMLPDYGECLRIEDTFRRGDGRRSDGRGGRRVTGRRRAAVVWESPSEAVER